MVLYEGNLSSKELNHHGLVELINKYIKNEDERRIVSPGNAVKALIINGLGF